MRRVDSAQKVAASAVIYLPMVTRLLLALTLLLTLVGCENTQAKELQRKTDERIAKIEAESQEKVAAAEKKIVELQGQLVEAGAQAKAEADEEVSKVKSEADKLASDATNALRKARAAYKENERHELAAALKELDEVKAKAQTAQAKVKTQVDQALKDIDAIDTATLETLKAAKAKADQALAQLKQAIHAARAKLQ